MKVQFFQPIDFNQMLVFSVFGHLLLLTVLLFLPKPRLLEKVVVPAFMVNLVSEPKGFKSAPAKRSESLTRVNKPKVKQPNKKIPVLNKTTASKSSKVKKVPALKTPQKLNNLEAKAALAIPLGEKIVEELDQLARSEKPKQPQRTKQIEKRPRSEKTFRELETLKKELETLKNQKPDQRKAVKNKKVDQRAVAPVPLRKDIVEELKMKERSPPPSPEEKQTEKPQSSEEDLLKELKKQLRQLDVVPVPKVKPQKPDSQESTQHSSEAFDSIMEKFSSFSFESETIRVETSSFQSKLRALPETSRSTTESGAGVPDIFAKKEGALYAAYVLMVKEKVDENLRESLAEKYNQVQVVVISFRIFSRGNIDKPVVSKSSGVEALDTRAVRAVLDSEPFSEFPPELKMPNLPMEMHFRYVPKDK